MNQRGLSTIATIVAVVLAVLGLAVVAMFVFMAIALSSLGSNK